MLACRDNKANLVLVERTVSIVHDLVDPTITNFLHLGGWGTIVLVPFLWNQTLLASLQPKVVKGEPCQSKR